MSADKKRTFSIINEEDMKSGCTSSKERTPNETGPIIDTGENAYEIQLFGFTPKSFCNGIYNALNQYLVDGLEAMKECLLSNHGEVMPVDEMNEGVSKIQQTIIKNVDQHFDKFEAYVLTNIMNIPAHVVLPEDQLQDTLPKEEQNIDHEIKELEEDIIAVKLANAMLEQELELADAVQEELNKLDHKIEACDSVLTSSALVEKDTLKHSITEVVKFVKMVPHIK